MVDVSFSPIYNVHVCLRNGIPGENSQCPRDIKCINKCTAVLELLEKGVYMVI
jgi:hypothetical protein